VGLMTVRDTSIEAYYNHVLPNISRSERWILEVFVDFYPAIEDWTNREVHQYLQKQVWGESNDPNCTVPNSSITARVKGLRDRGILISNGKRKCKVTTNRVYAWKINPVMYQKFAEDCRFMDRLFS